MPETETESKRDRIAKEIQKRIQRGFSKDKAHSQVKSLDEFNESYVTEVFEKFFRNDLEPRTDLQKEIIRVYDEDPTRTYVEISEIVADNLNRKSVDQSLVSDYTSRFRNDFRHKPNMPGGITTPVSKQLGGKVSFGEDGVTIKEDDDEEEEQDRLKESVDHIQSVIKDIEGVDARDVKTFAENANGVGEEEIKQAAEDYKEEQVEEEESRVYSITEEERFEILEALFKTNASEETIRIFLD